MNAFITGFRAYGQPRDDSDVDMVIMLDSFDACMLETLADISASDREEYKQSEMTILRFGKLNLMVCTTEAAYASWLAGTVELKAMRDNGMQVTRELAVLVFKKHRRLMGVDVDRMIQGFQQEKGK